MENSEMKTLTVERRGQIEILSLNRPSVLNAIDPVMAKELSAYFAGLIDRFETRVVLLRGLGRAFCAGADVGSLSFSPPGDARPQRQTAIQVLYSGIVRHMRKCPQPIIGLINGPSCGAGFSLALACDVRFGTPTARFQASYLRRGIGGCDMGSGYLLPRLVGLSTASEFLLSGRFIDAERAKFIGLIGDIVDEEKILDVGMALASDMLLASPMGLRMTKETLNVAVDAPSLDAGLLHEDRQQTMLMETADFREAVTAFKEKRAPEYHDR